MQIEFRHLHCIVAAADHGSFRRAARVLGIEISAVSRRVRDVEDQLGAELFTRCSGGVTPTLAGTRFIDRARKALENLQSAINEAGAVGRGEAGSVQIGVVMSIASGFAAELLRKYNLQNPGLRLEVVDGDLSQHIAAVHRRELDIAFLPNPTPSMLSGCDSAMLWHEPMAAAVPISHRLSEKHLVEWNDLSNETVLVRDTEVGRALGDLVVRRMSALGYAVFIEPCAVHRDGLLHLVAMGRGICLFNAAIAASIYPEVVFRSFAGEVFQFTAAWLQQNGNPALRRLLSLAKREAARQSIPVN